jgi:hypothetical protein
MRMLFSRFVSLVVLVGVGLAPGCGQKEASLTPVAGKVTVDGAPLSSGSVSLIPDVSVEAGAKTASNEIPGGMSGGEIKSDGTYKIYTGGKEGAPLGKYKVRVIPPVTAPKDDKETPNIGFDKKYTDAHNTPLHFEVVKNAEAGHYDLKLKK